MLAFLYVAVFVTIAVVATVILWSVWPPLAGAFVGFLWWREFFRY